MVRSSVLACSLVLGSLMLMLAASPALAEISPDNVLNMSLEQLTNIEVTSVSKAPEKANEAAAAIFVITADDIKRLGANSIPEALRIVPGLDVAQAGSNEWAVTSRGFNGQFANTMLVLIDGRTVYTPHFAGVWWDAQDVVLEDIDRIEVIRGPGATLWGANAVNGVINIITKSAKDTQGGMASFTAGNQINGDSTVRYGTKLDDDAFMRIYAKYTDNDEFRLKSGSSANDNWHKSQTGFRADWSSSADDKITLQGDAYKADESFILNLPSFVTPPATTSLQPMEANGFNLLSRWNHIFSSESNTTVQVYFDQADRKDAVYDDRIDTADFDFQHVWTGLERNEIIWGAGYRLVDDFFTDTPYYVINSPHRADNLFSSFVQDKIAIVPDKVFFTLGSKFEHNAYSGFEFEPSARVSWLVDSNQTIWSSVSRAVQSPSRTLADSNYFAQGQVQAGPFSGFSALAGSRSVNSEDVIAYELGHRIQPTKNLSFDTSVFYNHYTKLVVGTLGSAFPTSNSAFPSPFFIYPSLPENTNTAHSSGLEEAANWNVTDKWRLAASYTYLTFKIDQPDPFGYNWEGKQPRNQFNVRSTLLLPYNTEMDNALYYVASLPSIGIAGYYRFDTRLAWKATDGVDLSLVGQNLLRAEHVEFTGFSYQGVEEVPRTVFANVTFHF